MMLSQIGSYNFRLRRFTLKHTHKWLPTLVISLCPSPAWTCTDGIIGRRGGLSFTSVRTTERVSGELAALAALSLATT